ncbi:hypothetical protein [Shewanella phaeophyticola]|uniref:Uncharacterized protein n=1 Tax=Shewanella phaeophyticola TaxID=2978345 RepID=A0ABT2P5Q4_9GAMM|nr:hypothetical protein [Shewanella sp. KJ10-1]MCT8986576.1 hypothetical protein [Shewanella sp. KJ10-1]
MTDWAVLNTSVTQLKTSRYIDFDDLTNDSTTCATAGTLFNITCLGMVNTELTSIFLVGYTFSAAVLKIMSTMIDSEFEAFNVWVCYEDNVCIEFEAVAPWFSSLGWAATVNTSERTDTDGDVGGGGYDGSSGTTFIISCGVWCTYSGITADGTYCESWNVTMIR